MSQTIKGQQFHRTQDTERRGTMDKYVVVDSTTRKTREKSLARIDLHIKTVHIHGHLFVWVLREILEKAPGLEVIEVTPKEFERLTKTHVAMIEARGVALRFGYSPRIGVLISQAWTRENISRARQYKTRQKFLRGLRGESLAKFRELLLLELEEAEIAQRYFCLKEEPFISQHELGKLRGYAPASSATTVSIKIGAVLYYLDPTIQVSKKARHGAKTIHARVLLHELHLRELRGKASKTL